MHGGVGRGRWRGARFENGRHHDIKPFWVPGGIDLFRKCLLSLLPFFATGGEKER